MELEISGLKCDNCSYRDDTVKFYEYKYSIGKCCPNCGENLLTEGEYLNCLKIYKKIKKFKRIINFLKWFNPFHYWRLIFGDKRNVKTITIDYPSRTFNKNLLDN